jgi:hypothetical protein
MYKIIGADGKEYGPVSGEQMRRWIAEGRVENRTPVFAHGATDWNFAGLLPEFANCFPTTPPAIAPTWQRRESNSFATWGLICGILAWLPCCCCYGFPCNLLGLVFSLIGLAQINSQPERYEGRGTAIAGMALSVISLLLFAILIMWSIATGNFQVNGTTF